MREAYRIGRLSRLFFGYVPFCHIAVERYRHQGQPDKLGY
jgi:hypothetical protein